MSRFALLGDPVAHSKSPRMHAAAYRALGLAHTYEAIRAAPGELDGLVDRLRTGEFAGFNVTVPHKRRILTHVDAVEPGAQAVGAANTLVRDGAGRVVAHNTDVRALAEELRRLAPHRTWSEGAALVLGTGGAARSAVVALVAHLAVPRVVVRGRAPSDDLLTLGGKTSSISFESWAPSDATERGIVTVVQCTSAGMTGADPGDAVANAVAWSALPDDAVVLDVVYAPPETKLLEAARARGLATANGLGMLARQGALAFELWLGVPAPYEAMLTALA